MTDGVRFKDFTLPGDAPKFRIAPDVFQCYPEIALDALMEIAETARTGTESKERLEQMKELLKGIIVPEDYRLFIDRMRIGTEENPNPSPIGQRHLRDLIPWLMEVYGMRPTPESSTSADGSESDDTSSTDDASEMASTSSSFPSQES